MLALLHNIIQAVNSEENLNDILNVIVQRVRVGMRADLCAIFLADSAATLLKLRAKDSVNAGAIREEVSFEKGLVGLVARRCELVNTAQATSHQAYSPLTDEKYEAFIGVPIQYRRRLLGVLIVQRKESYEYDESSESFLMTLAVQLAGIIARLEVPDVLNQVEQEPTKMALTLRGFSGAPGVGIGHVTVMHVITDLKTVPDRVVTNPENEIRDFKLALAAVREGTLKLEEQLAANLPGSERELFDAYLKILDNPAFVETVSKLIREGLWAQGAVAKVVRDYVRQFELMENEYFRERADDLKDLGRQILLQLDQQEVSLETYARDTVLVGQEITVSHLGLVPLDHLVGIVSAKGSGGSHVAILARALGVPTVMGVGDLPAKQMQNKEVIVDGYSGRVHVSPKPRLLQAFRRLAREEGELDASLKALKQLPAETPDGYAVALHVNTGLMAGLERSLSVGAEGIGLYRTEMPFLMRERFPSLHEQSDDYRHLLEAFAPRPVVMRMLDIGGDKMLSYFPIEESNPFLGWRGIRVLLDHPEIFSTQLRAMLLANVGLNNLKIMLPMITDVSEVDEALRLIDKVYEEMRSEGISVTKPPVGVMIEVPAAVYQAKALAERVDFLSVGSNDLVQYFLAVDRNNSQVAGLYNSLHPTVLRALIEVVNAAHKVGKRVSICGEMAGDPASLILLLAMGFDILSMSSGNLLRAKWVIRTITMRQAKKILKKVLLLEDAAQIRQRLERVLAAEGLGGLVRPGSH